MPYRDPGEPMKGQHVGIFGSRHRPELARILLSVASAYLNDRDGSTGTLDAIVSTSRDRLATLADLVRADEGAKCVRKAKSEAMSFVWRRLTADPSTSFREGSPAKRVHDEFAAFLDELVPS